MFKVSNRNTRKRCEICWKLTIKTPFKVNNKNFSSPEHCIQKFDEIMSQLQNCVNPFHATDPFWYLLKISENLWFSNVFNGYQNRSLAWNGLILFSRILIIRDILRLINHNIGDVWWPSIFGKLKNSCRNFREVAVR